MNLISISSESPHRISNGYNLRVHNILVNASKINGVKVHSIAPVTVADNIDALAWADLNGIDFHGVILDRQMSYDKGLRAIFRKKGEQLLSSINEPESMVVLHGLVPINDFADLSGVGSFTADLIDEVGPLMVKDISENLVGGRLIEFLRSVKYLSVYYSKTIKLIGKYDHITVVAHDDARRLRRLLPSNTIRVVPNGVSLPDNHRSRNSSDSPIVVFHGVYSYQPNEEAALFIIRNVAPLLEVSCPQCKIVLVGRNPTQRMLEAGVNAENIEITGEVADMAVFLVTAAVGIYPVFTRTGLQNKILEAWSHGLPLVTTEKVLSVFRDFSQDAGQCALTAFTAYEFASKVVELLGDPGLRDLISEKSFEFVRTHFSWHGVVDKLLETQSDSIT